VDYLVRYTPYRTVEDRIDGVVVTFLDVTALRQTTAALAESEERFRLLVDGAQAYAMFLLDPDRCIIYWSNGAERVLGYTRDEMLGLTLYDFVAHDRAAIDLHARRIVEQHHVMLGERRYRRKDGTLVEVEVRVKLISLEERNVMCVIAREIACDEPTDCPPGNVCCHLCGTFCSGGTRGSGQCALASNCATSGYDQIACDPDVPDGCPRSAPWEGRCIIDDDVVRRGLCQK
jgi:PAS domain S-box-containing protein